MRRLLCMAGVSLLALISVICLAGGSRPQAAGTNNQTVSSDLFDFEAAMNGTVVKFPVRTEELQKLGWHFKGDPGVSRLEPKFASCAKLALERTGGHEALLMGNFYNAGKDAAAPSEVVVVNPVFSEEWMSGIHLEFAGGLRFGDSREKVLEVCGEPTARGRDVYVYRKDGSSREDYVEIIFRDDRLTDYHMHNGQH